MQARPVIDFSRPIRTVRSKRQLFVTGRRSDGSVMVDTTNSGHPMTGFAYDYDGFPMAEGCPLGRIENAPAETPFIEITEVCTPADLRRRREFAAALEANHDNPLWGAF
jgi:hypothetical protein